MQNRKYSRAAWIAAYRGRDVSRRSVKFQAQVAIARAEVDAERRLGATLTLGQGAGAYLHWLASGRGLAVPVPLGPGKGLDSPAFDTLGKLRKWRPETVPGAGYADWLRVRSVVADLQAIAQRAARKEAGWLQRRRGPVVSDTSTRDAVADVVCGVLKRLLPPMPNKEPDAWRRVERALASPLRRRLVQRWARAIASNSLRAWDAAGLTGDTSRLPLRHLGGGVVIGEAVAPVGWAGEFRDVLADELDGETIRGGRVRRAAAKRLWASIVGGVRREALASGAKPNVVALRVRSARRVWRVVAWVAMGESMANALYLGGFSGRRAGQDFQAAGERVALADRIAPFVPPARGVAGWIADELARAAAERKRPARRLDVRRGALSIRGARLSRVSVAGLALRTVRADLVREAEVQLARAVSRLRRLSVAGASLVAGVRGGGARRWLVTPAGPVRSMPGFANRSARRALGGGWGAAQEPRALALARCAVQQARRALRGAQAAAKRAAIA